MKNKLIILLFSIFLIILNLLVSQNLRESDIMIQNASFFSINESLMFWTLISFFLLLVLLKKYAFPNILKVIYDREDEILENYRVAKESRIKAEKIMLEQKEILEKISYEVSSKIKSASEEGKKIKEKYIQDALNEIENKRKQFDMEINLKKEDMLKSMDKKITFLSLEIAKELVQKNLDAKENIELIKKLIN